MASKGITPSHPMKDLIDCRVQKYGVLTSAPTWGRGPLMGRWRTHRPCAWSIGRPPFTSALHLWASKLKITWNKKHYLWETYGLHLGLFIYRRNIHTCKGEPKFFKAMLARLSLFKLLTYLILLKTLTRSNDTKMLVNPIQQLVNSSDSAHTFIEQVEERGKWRLEEKPEAIIWKGDTDFLSRWLQQHCERIL